MKWFAKSEFLEPRRYEIKHDPLVGFYLYVFENDKCIRDHLQDTLEIAIECAWEDYGVPKNAWQKAEENLEMKIRKIDSPASGTWARDCELISLVNDKKNGFILKFHKDSNDTYWSLKCEIMPAYKVVGEEFFRVGYLKDLPKEGAFFEVLDSPWIKELGEFESRIPEGCKHYVLQFYDETVEIIASKFIFEPFNEIS